MLHDQRVERLNLAGGDLPLLEQDLPERLTLVEHPSVHGGYERVAADEVHLQGEDPEQQVAIGIRPVVTWRHRSRAPHQRKKAHFQSIIAESVADRKNAPDAT